MAIENPTIVKVNSDDALTLAYALDLAWRFIHERPVEWDCGFRVRIKLAGQGDADMEQEYERLMNLLGYDT